MEGAFGRRLKVAVTPRAAQVASAADPTSNNVNRRFAPRRKSRTPGLIFPDRATSSIPCQIADISTTGARLLLQDGWSNPFLASEAGELTLVVRLDKVMYECKVIRREERELGVTFLTAPRPYAPRKSSK